MTDRNLQLISAMLKAADAFSNLTVEASLVDYACSKANVSFSYYGEFKNLYQYVDETLVKHFDAIGVPLDIELYVEFFEALLEKGNVNENGIVFTPQYIADYISKLALDAPQNSHEFLTIDPSCGCGIFLISAAKLVREKLGISLREAISNYIFGIDIDADNVRRCKLVLNLFLLFNGESNQNLVLNIKCADSLKTEWNSLFSVDSFDYIVGNPPYVNTHDMNKETALYLKKTFLTTQKGVYNIFYAFIEQAMKFLNANGKLGYIIPNNFLTIKSAESLRQLITANHYLEKIIDFADNMVFKPVRTYNCIVILSKLPNSNVKYCVLGKNENIVSALDGISFSEIICEKLDSKGWKLADKTTLSNIEKIEGQSRPIKDFIRTGIATLKDDVYIVDKDKNGFFKNVGEKRYAIDDVYVRKLYKIPDLKASDNLENVCRYAIFPYEKKDGGFQIINEDQFRKSAPNTYSYLLSRKAELDGRDKGNPHVPIWYAYGRTQGLNKYGRKLLFPTFASQPRFISTNDEYALFCNGYAVFENDYIELDYLAKILNSAIMEYYVSNTSYPIEGGYYCYQKKYIERFSLPIFSAEEIEKSSTLSKHDFDMFLIKKYGLSLKITNS